MRLSALAGQVCYETNKMLQEDGELKESVGTLYPFFSCIHELTTKNKLMAVKLHDSG